MRRRNGSITRPLARHSSGVAKTSLKGALFGLFRSIRATPQESLHKTVNIILRQGVANTIFGAMKSEDEDLAREARDAVDRIYTLLADEVVGSEATRRAMAEFLRRGCD